MDSILADLGLTNLEVSIYKILLNEGSLQAGNISRLTGIHRRNVYDALERLIQKGFVSYIKENNIKSYVAGDPQLILDKLKSKEKEWTSLMPDLKKKLNATKKPKETLFFRGINNIKNVFLDQISVGEEVLVFGTNTQVDRVVKHFFPKYQLLRKENKIKTRMIFDTSVENKSLLKSLPLCKIKFLENYNSSSTSEYVYGNNVAIIVWDKQEPFAILIRQEEIARAKRDLFELLWE